MDLSPHPRPTGALAATAPARRAFTFICTACECIVNERQPKLPPHWQIGIVGDDERAFCPHCAERLQRKADQAQGDAQ